MHDGKAVSLVLAAFLITNAPSAMADNTGGVFGPVVNDGQRSAQYRAAWDADSYAFAQRLHYQSALDDDRMWRVIAQTRKTADRDFDPDFVQAELFWQLDDVDDGWRHGLRFDVRVRTEGRPAQIGVNWMNEFDIGSQWRARFLVLTSAEIGDGRRRGLRFETRGSLDYRLRPGTLLGAELYSSYGRIDDIPGFDRQSHQLGPTLTANVGQDWQIFGGVLFGLTDATPDTQLRVWTTRRF